MNTKHTQGPWHIGKRYPAGAIYDEKGAEICGFSNLLHPAEVSANARLISAAPDLFEALKELLADKYLADPINADRMARTRAALDKAQGNQ